MLKIQLKFEEHLKMVPQKISKAIGSRELHNLLPRAALITTYKSLSDSILIMVIFFMMKHIICLCTKAAVHSV